jgi:hypothetical protein
MVLNLEGSQCKLYWYGLSRSWDPDSAGMLASNAHISRYAAGSQVWFLLLPIKVGIDSLSKSSMSTGREPNLIE